MARVDSDGAGALLAARILVLALGIAPTLPATEASAQEQRSESRLAETGVLQHTLADLEKAFWVCDHAATVYGVLEMGAAIACAAVTRDFRLSKFNGDFDAMLTWWERNKAHEHRLLELRHRAAGHR